MSESYERFELVKLTKGGQGVYDRPLDVFYSKKDCVGELNRMQRRIDELECENYNLKSGFNLGEDGLLK